MAIFGSDYTVGLSENQLLRVANCECLIALQSKHLQERIGYKNTGFKTYVQGFHTELICKTCLGFESLCLRKFAGV